MEAQEVFDTVVSHLRTQRRPAYTLNQCWYRIKVPTLGDDITLKCAIGCLISDSEYSPMMEGHTVTKLVGSPKTYGVSDALMSRLLVPHRSLLQRLQSVHDSDRRVWEESLETVAYNFKLKYTPVSTSQPCLHELEAAHKTDSNYKCKHCGKAGGH